ncbi:MAG TPA: hypothetical protein VFJ07_11605 [Streptosporangiaceae bacterium]|nr:hypothetical protein [Streptosporangiaceae bacterium]
MLPADPFTVFAVAFSRDGKLLVSADSDGTVRRWDPVTRRAVAAPLHASARNGVSGVAFSPDGKLLASAASDGTVRLWQVSPFVHPYAALCADVGPPTRQRMEPTTPPANRSRKSAAERPGTRRPPPLRPERPARLVSVPDHQRGAGHSRQRPDRRRTRPAVQTGTGARECRCRWR